MTDTTNNEPTASKTPAYILSHVEEREGGESKFTELGVAWPHKDGKGYNIRTMFGLLMLRVPPAKKK